MRTPFGPSRRRLRETATFAVAAMLPLTAVAGAHAAGPGAALQTATASATSAPTAPVPAGEPQIRELARVESRSTIERSARPDAADTDGTVGSAATAVPATLYNPLAPLRVLDTRSGLGAAQRKVGQGASIVLDVAAALRVAPGSVDAVALNLTTTRATSPGYVSVCPASLPVATCASSSSISTSTSTNIAALVVSKVDAAGKVRLYNYRGSVDLVADVHGYFDDSTTRPGDSYETNFWPERYFDTRELFPEPMGPQEALTVDFFDPDPDFPDEKITSVVLNLTATQVSELTYFSACPAAPAYANPDSCIGTSVLNAYPGRNTPNLVVVQLDENGEALFYNSRGTAHMIGDVQGVFYDDQIGATYHPVDPTRVLDTRRGTGGVPAAKVGPRQAVRFVPDPLTLPLEAEAAMLTVTATGVTAPSTYLSVCPGWMSAEECGTVSNLNPKSDRTVSNMAASMLGAADAEFPARENELMVYNRSGESHVVADLQGYFVRPPG